MKILSSKIGVILAAALGVSSHSHAEDTRVKCDFAKVEQAEKAMRGREPALIGSVQGAMTPVALDSVYVIDSAIRRKVMAQDLFARRTPSGSIELVARIVNCTDHPLQVQGRTSFMDSTKFPTENPSAWQTVFIEPRSFGTYREVSIGRDQVAYYLIELQGNK